jgi:hypothetical protein
MTYNLALQHCPVVLGPAVSIGDSSLQDTQEEEADKTAGAAITSSVTPSTCKVLQGIARMSSNMCRTSTNSCQVLECAVEMFRFDVAILPCGETPGVMVAMDHLQGEGGTLFHNTYTETSREVIHLEGIQLLTMEVSIQQPPNMDHITLTVN